MKRILRLLAAFVLPLGLSGCLDLAMRSDLQSDGSMTIYTEIGLDKAVVTQVAQMQAPPSGKGKSAGIDGITVFAAMCKDGYDGVPAGIAPMPKGRRNSKAGEAAAALPKPNGTVSERDGFLVCTLKETFADPVKQYAEMAEKSGLTPAAGTITLLPDGKGYRFDASLRSGGMLRDDKTFSEEDKASAAMIAGMIPREMTTSVTISGVKVENANGTVSADGKSVTWKIPIHRLVDLRPGAEPIKMTADVYFK